MRFRRDPLFVSSLLFSVVLVWLAPKFLADAWTWRRSMFQVTDHLSLANYLAPIGFASLAIVLIGLVTVWKGYLQGVRSAWIIMFIIVWVWAFPVMILPILQHGKGISSAEWLHIAIREPSPYRDLAEVVVMFSLAVLALVLPIRSFLGRRQGPPTEDKPPGSTNE